MLIYKCKWYEDLNCSVIVFRSLVIHDFETCVLILNLTDGNLSSQISLILLSCSVQLFFPYNNWTMVFVVGQLFTGTTAAARVLSASLVV